MRPCIVIGIIVIFFNGVFSEDSSESGVATSPLSIYSGGGGVGTMHSLTDTLKMESKSFFKLSYINDIYLVDNLHLFADLDWLAPRANFDVDVGIDYLLMTSRFRPFLGAGVGASYFDKKGYNFGSNIGPSGTLHLGFIADISRTTQLRVRIPFHLTLNQTRDCLVGLDIGVLFSEPYRHIKKLEY